MSREAPVADVLHDWIVRLEHMLAEGHDVRFSRASTQLLIDDLRRAVRKIERGFE